MRTGWSKDCEIAELGGGRRDFPSETPPAAPRFLRFGRFIEHVQKNSELGVRVPFTPTHAPPPPLGYALEIANRKQEQSKVVSYDNTGTTS